MAKSAAYPVGDLSFRYVKLHVLLIFTLVACQPSDSDELPAGSHTFVPAPVPELVTETDETQAPVYLYLYTHTEDHINHTLSEARYTRIAPLVESTAKAHPDAQLTWVIEFQGADALTVSERNSQTGIVDLLKGLAQQDLVEFGYHAHHEPTYQNRPQKSLSAESSWDEWVEGIRQWISCQKDPLYGGCEVQENGGLVIIGNNFGPVQIVSGVYCYSPAANEGGPAHHAVSKYLPDRMLGLGFPDHGGSTGGDYDAALKELLKTMSPSVHTSPTVLWVDDVIKINDGNALDEVSTLRVRMGIKDAQKKIDSLDRSRPQVLNTLIADKFIYTAEGESPTIWAYGHPEPTPEFPNNPELPVTAQKSAQEIEAQYVQTELTLEYLAGDLRTQDPAIRFASSQQIVSLISVDDYWTVTAAELDVIARWLVLNWNGRPPPYASDGDNFYSLRDAFVLLVKALSSSALPASVELSQAY